MVIMIKQSQADNSELVNKHFGSTCQSPNALNIIQMKYIFRYTILTQYTNNPDALKPSDLLATLKSVNFSQIDKIQPIIETCRTAAEALLKNIGKSAQSAADAAKDIIAQVFGQDYEPYFDELVQVWEAEKQQVLSKVLMQSSRCQAKLAKLTWQINSEIGSKLGGAKERSAVVSILSTNADKSISKTTVELNKPDLAKFSEALISASQFLDANLK